jgi:hypothetical protein
MQEAPVSSEVVATEPQEGGTPRRITDYSQIDCSQPEIRRALKGAYRVLLKYRVRRLGAQAQEEER